MGEWAGWMNFHFINLTSILELCTHDYGATLIETVSIGTKKLQNTWLSICPCVEWFNFNWGFSALGLRLLFLTDQIIRFHMSKLNAQPENVLPLIEIERKICEWENQATTIQRRWNSVKRVSTRLRILLYNCTQLDFEAKVIYGLGFGKKSCFFPKTKRDKKKQQQTRANVDKTFVAN